MSEIRVLEPNIANKIAAGEVVERPGSVIKELVENAMDAGATSITVEIRNGGITYMRVTDNGSGMSRENAERAFLRHATSKIRDISDLYAIQTLGFRGEALAAISAVSRVELITAEENKTGTRITLEGGEQISCEDTGAPQGTTMIVRDLFFNTPARMKFLKTDRSEASNIIALMERLALSNPHIAFRVINEDKNVLTTTGNGKLSDVIYAVMGKEISKGMLPVDTDLQQVRVYGYAAIPTVTHQNRNYQLCFINGRLVKSQTVFAAIDRAYQNTVFHGRQAICVLKIRIPYGLVDVNVHPSKMEVKFSNEKMVFEAVYYAIKGALNRETYLKKEEPKQPAQNTLIPPRKPAAVGEKPSAFGAETILEKPIPLEGPESVPAAVPESMDPEDFRVTLPPQSAFKLQSSFALHEDPTAEVPDPALNKFESSASAVKTEPGVQETLLPGTEGKRNASFRYIGELFRTYLLIEYQDELILIDKHAAHERMIFERLLRAAQSGERMGQALLVPETVQLSVNELQFAEEEQAEFARIGFDFDVFGEKQILLRSCPTALADESAGETFTEILEQWMRGDKRKMTERENSALKTVACKAAIKAGFINDSAEMKAFVTALIESDEIHQCPHGRPIAIAYDKKTIEKRFRRI